MSWMSLLVLISSIMKKKIYIPKPIDTTDVKLPEQLYKLVEILAKDVHDTWAAHRFADGWTYGPQRDDTHRTHPCLVPYEELPETEREYDRATAIHTLKLITKLGFTIKANKNQS